MTVLEEKKPRLKSDPSQRITSAEALSYYKNMDLLELGARANEIRFQKNPKPIVTFVIDSNPNYTNVCVTDCSFCAFYRKPGSVDAYTLTLEQVLEKVKFASDQGATTVLLQGGHNPELPFRYYLDLVREVRKRFPQITPHFFTASEIQTMAQVSKLPIEEVLRQLKQAGQVSLPGGGAEILSERVRKRISPKKGGPDKWLEVHRAAHRLGIKSTAMMMYGHVEEADEIVEHLERIRQLQDETGGFTAFVPWSFKPNNTPLQKKIVHRPSANQYLRILALSRIYLDNFPHIQATWFSEGKKTGQAALHFGADDFGGTLFEENVHRATNHINRTTLEEIQTLIRESGFQPAQRDTLYNILKN
ncbi:MAG: dehypoxanthine futalosine cyclase [Elusimicrobia bacterium]|nr:dehypoxanthine futalosine cyclase [Elusimicrobiota bacterium]